MTDDAPRDPPEAAPHVTWAAGGHARVVTAEGIQVALRSSRPFPPGAPVQGTLGAGATPRGFTLKITGNKLVAPGQWALRGRLLTAPADVLAAFAAVASGAR